MSVKEGLDEWVKQFYKKDGIQEGIGQMYVCKISGSDVSEHNLLFHHLKYHYSPRTKSFSEGEFTKNYNKYLVSAHK